MNDFSHNSSESNCNGFRIMETSSFAYLSVLVGADLGLRFIRILISMRATTRVAPTLETIVDTRLYLLKFEY